MADQNREPVILQEIKVKGSQLVEKVREVMEEGNARSLSIKKDGKTVFTVPLSVGVGGAAAAVLLHPTLAAVGAFAALVTDVSIEVERVERPAATSQSTESISESVSSTNTPPSPTGF